MNYKRIQHIINEKGYAILPVKTGMQLELYEKIGDAGTERIQKFKGLVIKVKKPNNMDGTFTIRGTSAGMVIEKVYPLSFPKFEKVLLLDEYRTRREKLYFIRNKVGKSARFKSKILAEDREKNILPSQ